jgi:hypothetical protein
MGTVPRPGHLALPTRVRQAEIAQSPWLPRLAITAIVLLGTLIIARYGLRLHATVIFDEKLTVGGARYYHDDPGKLFDLDGFAGRGLERLTSILFLPLVVLFGDVADQFVVGHFWFALLFSLSALPAYFLARGLRASVGWAIAAAALTVLTPWALFAMTFLNNATAATALAFAVWAAWRAVVRPSPVADGLALIAYLLAGLARVSFAPLAIAFPIAVIVLALRDRRPWRAVLRDHWVLWGAMVFAALVVVFKGGALVGVYPTSGVFDPVDLFERVGRIGWHVAAATAVVPAIVGLGWLAWSLVRPADRETGTFAVLAVVTLLALVFVTQVGGGYDERYELPSLLLLVVPFAVALSRRQLPVVPLAGAAALVGWAMYHFGSLPFSNSVESDYLYAPAGQWLSRVWLNRIDTYLGFSHSVSLVIIWLAGCAVVALLVWGRFRWLPAAFTVVALVLGVVGARWAMDKLTDLTRPDTSFAQLNFVDDAVGGGQARPLANPNEYNAAVPQLWDDLRYFNASVSGAMSVGASTYGVCCGPSGRPFVADLNPDTGALSASSPFPSHILTRPDWVPYGLVTQIVAESKGIVPLIRVEKLLPPVRAAWISEGIDTDGSLKPGRRAALRVYPAQAEDACLRVGVLAATFDRGRVRWQVGGEHGTLGSGQQAIAELPVSGSRTTVVPVRAPGPTGLARSGRPAALELFEPRVVQCGD